MSKLVESGCGYDNRVISPLDLNFRVMNSFKRLYQAPALYVYPCMSCEGVVRVLGFMVLRKFFKLTAKFDHFGRPLYFYKF